MNLQEIRQLFSYHYWARDRMLDAVAALTPEQYTREIGGSFGSIRQTLVHIYAAEWAWHSRWHGYSPAALSEAGELLDFDALRDAWTALETRMRATLDAATEDDLARSFDYKLLSGQPGRSTFQQVLQHVVNHATYHRGQVTTMLRQLGAQPPRGTDLILFHREQQAGV